MTFWPNDQRATFRSILRHKVCMHIPLHIVDVCSHLRSNIQHPSRQGRPTHMTDNGRFKDAATLLPMQSKTNDQRRLPTCYPKVLSDTDLTSSLNPPLRTRLLPLAAHSYENKSTPSSSISIKTPIRLAESQSSAPQPSHGGSDVLAQ